MRRRRFRFGQISWKLTLLYSLLFSGVLLLLSAGVLYGVRYFLFDQAYATVRSSADETVASILATDGSQAALADGKLLGEALSDSDINIIIAAPGGEVLNQSSNFDIQGNNILYKPGVIRRVENNGMHLMVYNSSVKTGGQLVATLQVAYNLGKDYRFINILFVLMAASDALGIVLSVFVGYFVSRRMLRPIDRITRTAQRISIRDLGTRIPIGEADDELSRLAVTFNAMLDRLQASIDKQGRFVSDASHELRTPLSVMLGYIGLMDRWGKNDPKVLQESIDAIRGEAVGMHELVEKLLFLARGDSGKANAAREPVDLAVLLGEVAEESRMIAPGKNITAQAAENLALRADARMVKQMLRNLVDNSIKFTREDGSIALHAESAGQGRVRITVEDDGIGIPPQDTERIFDRFYRVDKARAKDTGGSGLGLAIVRSIVEAHGGEIGIESAPGKGTRISILLPQS